MNRMKICAAAAGFALAAGITTAGNIVINSGEISGTYSTIEVAGDGTVTVHGFTDGTGTTGPVAAFTTSCSDLTCSVNGSGSSSSSGSIVSWSWEFGDGSTGTGSSTSHTYADYGSYTIKLTVQDSEGATASKSTTRTLSDSSTGGGGTGDCAGFTPPFPGSTTTFANFLSSLSGGVERFRIDRGNHLAIPFTSPGSGKAVKFAWEIGTHAANPGATYSVSPCQGDFSGQLGKACRVYGSNGFLYIATSSTGGAACDIQPNTKYFLNIVYAKGTGNSLSDTCTSWSRCGADFAWYNVSYLL